MGNIDMAYYKSWFDQYVQQYLNAEESTRINYQLKLEHSLRVHDLMLELGQSLNFDMRSLNLGRIIGLMHDLGRFKQYADYNTFSDRVTGSHAKISVDILSENAVLKNLAGKEQAIVLKAIEYHNYYRIPQCNSEEILLFSRLIRDADKLDGLFLVTDDSDQRRYDLDSLSEQEYFSSVNIDNLLNNQPIDYKNIHYQFDRKLVMLGLVFDINFQRSFEIINENDYIRKIINQLPATAEIRKVGENCREYIIAKLKEM